MTLFLNVRLLLDQVVLPTIPMLISLKISYEYPLLILSRFLD